MTIELIQPHEKQIEIVKACLDPNIFFIVAVIGRQFGRFPLSLIRWGRND
jgi:hypothetical protein